MPTHVQSPSPVSLIRDHFLSLKIRFLLPIDLNLPYDITKAYSEVWNLPVFILFERSLIFQYYLFKLEIEHHRKRAIELRRERS